MNRLLKEERELPLLGQEIWNFEDPGDWAKYVQSLYIASTTQRKISIKGKTLVTPTKKREGRYKITFGDKELETSFSKESGIKKIILPLDAASKLGVAEQELEKFLSSKKFSCMRSEPGEK